MRRMLGGAPGHIYWFSDNVPLLVWFVPRFLCLILILIFPLELCFTTIISMERTR